jgi:hypothetical protein
MELNFSIDHDASEVHGVFDDAIAFSVILDNDDRIICRNINKLDDELQKPIINICRQLLKLENH